MAELVGFDAAFLQEGEPVVGEWGVLFGEDDVAAVFDVFGAAAGDDGGDVFEFVAGAEVGAVADEAVVEEAGVIGVLRFFESVDEMGEEAGAFFIAFAGSHDAGLGESVVAEGVGFERDAHAGEEGADGLAVGDDVGHAGLEGDDDHVGHEVDCFFAGDAFIGCFEGGVGLGDIGPLGLAPESFFDLADAGEIFVELFAVAFAKAALHAGAIEADEVEDGLLFLEAGIELGTGVAGMGEELVVEFEGLVDAGDGVAVLVPGEGEAFSVARVLAAVLLLGGENEGGEAGVFSEARGGDLVAGNGIVKALAGGAGDVGSGEVGCGAAVGSEAPRLVRLLTMVKSSL